MSLFGATSINPFFGNFRMLPPVVSDQNTIGFHGETTSRNLKRGVKEKLVTPLWMQE